MKTLALYINEALHVNSNTKIQTYNYHPKTNSELKELVRELVKERGIDADLNDIDTSEITDMSNLFYNSKFNGDISEWDVSNVKDMSHMFEYSKFNGDISKWDVSNVTDMYAMFMGSEFDGDISEWDVSVSNVKYMTYMFYQTSLQKNPPKWYIKK